MLRMFIGDRPNIPVDLLNNVNLIRKYKIVQTDNLDELFCHIDSKIEDLINRIGS
jgi:hypothetical protein